MKRLHYRCCWVLFKNGTVVLCGVKSEGETNATLIATAKLYLKEHGRIIVGTPVADFTATFESEMGGWIVQFQVHKYLFY